VTLRCPVSGQRLPGDDGDRIRLLRSQDVVPTCFRFDLPEAFAMIDQRLKSPAFVSALIDTISFGLERCAYEDAETALDALRIIRPDLVEADVFEAMIGIRRGRCMEAIRVLSRIEAARPQWSMGRALLAFCQYSTGQAGWLMNAREALKGDPDAATVRLVKLLLVRGQEVCEDSVDEQESDDIPPLRLMAQSGMLRV
jgi:type III secretion protein HrpB1